MTTEELNAIRDKLAKVFGEQDEEGLCLICDHIMALGDGLVPTPTCHKCAQQMVLDDLPRLCDEVERLQEQLQSLPLTGDWLSDLANKCAYQIHRVIGNNIEYYRGQTAKELRSLIEAAVSRNLPETPR